MRTVITNVKAVLEHEIQEHIQVVLEDGRIKAIGQPGKIHPGLLLADEVFDGGGQYLAPGLIDIHLHGGAGYDFMDAVPEAFQKIADYHSAHGITSMLATTLAGEEQETLAALQAFVK